MSETSQSSEATDQLQFETAEPMFPRAALVAAQACVGCGQPITSSYYADGDRIICPRCHELISGKQPGNAAFRCLRATTMGLGAGLTGAAIWFLVRRYFGLQSGIVAVLVGFMVGTAVRKGSGGRSGTGYQVLAVLLTYCSIAANYLPDIVQNARKVGERQTISLFAAECGIALAIPISMLSDSRGLIEILLIGFALYEAWSLARSRHRSIKGPFQLGVTRPPAPGQPPIVTSTPVAG